MGASPSAFCCPSAIDYVVSSSLWTRGGRQNPGIAYTLGSIHLYTYTYIPAGGHDKKTNDTAFATVSERQKQQQPVRTSGRRISARVQR